LGWSHSSANVTEVIVIDEDLAKSNSIYENWFTQIINVYKGDGASGVIKASYTNEIVTSIVPGPTQPKLTIDCWNGSLII